MSDQKKSALRVGINGFGRIGRLIFRQGFDSLNIVLINGTRTADQLAYFLKYDSIHGTWPHSVSSQGDKKLIVNGKSISCLQEKEPRSIDWSKHNVDIVIECSGRFKEKSDWDLAFSQGVKKVIVSAPAKNPDFTLVYGVNQHLYKKDEHKFISTASCTTNCLAPLIKVLKESWGIEKGFFSTVHAYTNDQKLLDSSHKTDLRRSRSAGLNIIPTSTGAGQALSLVFPDLKNCIQGQAFRVPTALVSLLDLVVEIKQRTSLDQIHKVFEQATQGDMKGILSIEKGKLVSSDFIGRTESSIIDFPLMDLQEGHLLKLVSWYDNESGFSARIIDFIHYMQNNKTV